MAKDVVTADLVQRVQQQQLQTGVLRRGVVSEVRVQDYQVSFGELKRQIGEHKALQVREENFRWLSEQRMDPAFQVRTEGELAEAEPEEGAENEAQPLKDDPGEPRHMITEGTEMWGPIERWIGRRIVGYVKFFHTDDRGFGFLGTDFFAEDIFVSFKLNPHLDKNILPMAGEPCIFVVTENRLKKGVYEARELRLRSPGRNAIEDTEEDTRAYIERYRLDERCASTLLRLSPGLRRELMAQKVVRTENTSAMVTRHIQNILKAHGLSLPKEPARQTHKLLGMGPGATTPIEIGMGPGGTQSQGGEWPAAGDSFLNHGSGALPMGGFPGATPAAAYGMITGGH